MLCPDCRHRVAGGTRCPQCRQIVPERETFSGQGGRYLLGLVAISLGVAVLFVLGIGLRSNLAVTLRYLRVTGWIWLYIGVLSIPILIGIYYWFMLREEEVVVTDEGIVRRSRWGDEYLAWRQVSRFRRSPLLVRQTRLGRFAWLSRHLARDAWSDWPPASYELYGPDDADGEPCCLRLEPGTIDDFPWLLELISAHAGPPQED